MTTGTCIVRWRSSGGRGEFELVKSAGLLDKEIDVFLPALGLTIPAEVFASLSQGKPRLRKFDSNNRSKLHLVQLVMALARLPDPAREDKGNMAMWPLEHKGFLISEMDFTVHENEKEKVVLVPTFARILHSERVIDLTSRFNSIAADLKDISQIAAKHPSLAAALQTHFSAIQSCINSKKIREAANKVIDVQAEEFGLSNTTAPSTIEKLPHTPLEDDVKGTEGRILTRLHSYRERDRTLVKKAKALFKAKHGKLFCECCGYEPAKFYGPRGENRIEAHHRTPVEELVADAQTTAADLAMLCPNCHDIVHAARPWITAESLRADLIQRGTYIGDPLAHALVVLIA